MKAAVISEASGLVINTIELAPEANWQAPAGTFVHFDESASIGMQWDGEKIVHPSEGDE